MENSDSNSSNNSWQSAMETGEQVFLSLVGTVMAVVGGLGNGVVVALVCCSPAMRSAINLLLATLALTDTMVMLLMLPLDIVTLIGRKWLLPVSLCYAHEFLLAVTHLQGVVILTIICIDRYIIIVHRQDRLTPSTACWVIAGSWVLSACLALPPMVGLGSHVVPPLPVGVTHCIWRPSTPPSPGDLFYGCTMFIFVYLLPIFIISACFGSILRKFHKASAKVHNNKGDATLDYNGIVECPQEKHNEAKSSSSRRTLVPLDLRYKTQTFTTILMLFLVFVAFRSPLHLAQLVSVFTKEDKSYHKAYVWLLWWAYLQPAVNPVIYTIRIKTIREELFEYFPCLLHVVSGPASRGYRRSDPKAIYMIHEPRPDSSN
ncbi:probable G-protein coupled receptor 45 [Macrobrachium rosenbergii]|uniref:probable G-protein coupled receptor 45 n=1 Tax=Macrobrachium rosenbergii TaxID=79674 RepID=UPI0034D4B592